MKINMLSLHFPYKKCRPMSISQLLTHRFMLFISRCRNGHQFWRAMQLILNGKEMISFRFFLYFCFYAFFRIVPALITTWTRFAKSLPLCSVIYLWQKTLLALLPEVRVHLVPSVLPKHSREYFCNTNIGCCSNPQNSKSPPHSTL